ncbi:MAG: nucleoside monophosphate kinase [Patescibacteria group bacterium]|nr:nucleoside monophosphate kinase [Patescibacteria group bacterium]
MSHRLLHLVIIGAQEAGKGTQAKLLSTEYGLVHIEIGNRLREMAQEQSPIAPRISETIKQGHLIPDDLATEIIELQLGGIPPNTGFILDGYPRTVDQAGQLHHMLHGFNRLEPQPVFINLEVPKSELSKRLLKRRQLEGRHDDIAPVIKRRHALYHEQTRPVLDAVKEWAAVIDVNGNQSVEAVAKEIKTKLPNGKSGP